MNVGGQLFELLSLIQPRSPFRPYWSVNTLTLVGLSHQATRSVRLGSVAFPLAGFAHDSLLSVSHHEPSSNLPCQYTQLAQASGTLSPASKWNATTGKLRGLTGLLLSCIRACCGVRPALRSLQG